MSSSHPLYSVFGLVVQSSIECPELSPGTGDVDVRIVRGDVPLSLGNAPSAPLFELDRDRALLTVPGVARFLVSSGREIRVDVEEGADVDTVRLFLLGSPMGALLHQRGILPLHASAVAFDGGAVAFVGASGAGKSTMVAGFSRRGFPVISDDICAVSRGAAGEPLVATGPPHMKLWADTISHLFKESQQIDLPRVRPEIEKFRVSVGTRSDGSVALRRVYVLKIWNQNTIRIDRLNGARKLEALIWNTYRLRLVDHEAKKHHFLRCAHAAERASVRMVLRPQNAPFNAVVETVLADLRGAA